MEILGILGVSFTALFMLCLYGSVGLIGMDVIVNVVCLNLFLLSEGLNSV